MFKGSIVAIITPFNADKSINRQKFIDLIKWHIAKGTNGIVVAGTTGEGTTLSDNEKLELFKIAVETVNKKIPVIANCGSNDTMHSYHLSAEAQKIGVDGLLLINPYYNKCNHEGMYQHFATVAQSIDLPIILYNVPSRTGVTIPLSVVARLTADHKNIIYMKDAGGDLEYTLKAMKYLAILSGDDNGTYELMVRGAKGVISVVANLLPSEYSKMCSLALEGDFENAMTIHRQCYELVEHLFLEVNPIVIKEAMNIAGHQIGGYRLPLTKMSDENYFKLKKVMEGK